MKTNQAFIDGQNLFYGTTKARSPWRIDLKRFRVFLEEKYEVGQAYYFLGYTSDEYAELYTKIQEAGFILVFREHSVSMRGRKKGNVDTDIVFEVMRKLFKDENLDKVVLVSGDGDYCRMVDFLIKEHRFEKILFPNTQSASSLYKFRIADTFRAFLDDKNTKTKIIVR
jgi:uncharacterized LabA/DUF88 family protein